MTNLKRRLRNLEAVLTDTSRFVPNSQKWLEYWDRRVYLYMIGEAPLNEPRFPLDAVRAVLRNSDNPGSLVGGIPDDESNDPAVAIRARKG
jgi:hypothetical protein